MSRLRIAVAVEHPRDCRDPDHASAPRDREQLFIALVATEQHRPSHRQGQRLRVGVIGEDRPIGHAENVHRRLLAAVRDVENDVQVEELLDDGSPELGEPLERFVRSAGELVLLAQGGQRNTAAVGGLHHAQTGGEPLAHGLRVTANQRHLLSVDHRAVLTVGARRPQIVERADDSALRFTVEVVAHAPHAVDVARHGDRGDVNAGQPDHLAKRDEFRLAVASAIRIALHGVVQESVDDERVLHQRRDRPLAGLNVNRRIEARRSPVDALVVATDHDRHGGESGPQG